MKVSSHFVVSKSRVVEIALILVQEDLYFKSTFGSGVGDLGILTSLPASWFL